MNILITGGSSEIAQAIALRRFSLGDQILITSSTEENLKATIEVYKENNIPVKGFVYNFSTPQKCTKILHKILQQPVDAVILNAFSRVTQLGKLHEISYEWINDYLQQNIAGNIWLIRQLLPTMLEKKFGRLVFISSLSAIAGTSGYGAYCAAKSALEGLFLNLAVEYSKHNILSNIVRLGLVKTTRTKKFWSASRYQEKIGKRIPLGNMGEPHQIAEILDPLLSLSSYMTGSVVNVTGGLPLISWEGLSQ